MKGKSSSKDEMLNNLIEEYGDYIFRICFSYVKNRTISEDLTQEIFIKVYKKFKKFRGDSSIKTWLVKIATNHCRDYLRSSYYKTTLLTDFIDSFLKKEKREQSAEDAAMVLYKKDELTDLILSLPMKYREVLILYYFNELTIREISISLSQNENTIKTRLIKARNILKNEYKEKEVLQWKEN